MKIETTLTPAQIAAAWRNPATASELPEALRQQVPANPAGTPATFVPTNLPESHHNSIGCQTTNCFSAHCASLLCPTGQHYCG